MNKTENIENALEAYFSAMSKNYDRFMPPTYKYRPGYKIFADKPGKKFLRIWHSDERGNHRSSHSFIVMVDHVTSSGLVLRMGDILKCASWKAPALNFVRGNIFDRDYGNSSWTGAM